MVTLQIKLTELKKTTSRQKRWMSQESEEKQLDLNSHHETLQEKEEMQASLAQIEKELAGKTQAIERLRGEIKWLKNELSVDEDEHDDMRIAMEKMRREIEQEREQRKYLEEEL